MFRLKLVSCVNVVNKVRRISCRPVPSSSLVSLGIPIITQYQCEKEEQGSATMDSTPVSHGPKACGSKVVVSRTVLLSKRCGWAGSTKRTQLAHNILVDEYTYLHPVTMKVMVNDQLLDELSMPDSPGRHQALLPCVVKTVAEVPVQAECLPGSSPSVQLLVPWTAHWIQMKPACKID